MSKPSLLDPPETQDKDRDIDAAERIERARKAREAAEKQIRERNMRDKESREWFTERAWRSR